MILGLSLIFKIKKSPSFFKKRYNSGLRKILYIIHVLGLEKDHEYNSDLPWDF